MDVRPLVHEHLRALTTLLRSAPPPTRTADGWEGGDDDLEAAALRVTLEVQQRLLRRILSEPGDPTATVLAWRERTEAFCNRYPEREGWTDRQGETWNAQEVLRAIDLFLEQLDQWSESLAEAGWDDDAPGSNDDPA